MPLRAQRAWLPWFSIALLALLCAILAVLQYRWTGEIANAERGRLQDELQSRLNAASHAFNDNLSMALRALTPDDRQIQQLGWQAAWSAQYLQWKSTHPPLIQRAGVEAFSEAGHHTLNLVGANPPSRSSPNAVEVPIRDIAHDRLLIEVNLDYVRSTLLPGMLQADYDIEVVTNDFPRTLIYTSLPGTPAIWNTSDGSTPLLELHPDGPPGGRPGQFDRGPGPPPPFGGPGRWRLLARHKSGSLEALVARTQQRNLAVSAAVLILILGTVAMLIRYSRQAQHLADLQMNFVTGVSHELRTPLTVIRTAAYNLRTPRFRRSEEHVERYGKMIEAEAGKLERLVEQVMRFAGASAGHAVRDLQSVALAELIEAEISDLQTLIETRGIVLETHLEPGLPVVMADAGALRQALRNLLDNALKYGAVDAKWIGITGRTVHGSDGDSSVEICIADKGPGIPASEQNHIFDPFFRGRRAIQDQVHGTGLGLSLVKTIVEAHAGQVTVTSDDSSGARFTIRIPSAPASLQTGAAR
jgi:signal transduction histidine kinase